MAWRKEPSPPLSNKKASSQKGRTLWDFTGHFPCFLLPLITTDMENTQCFPCLSLINLLRNCWTWTEFHKPTPRGDRQRRRLWNSWNSLTLGISLPTFLSHILERIFLCGEHLGTWGKSPTCPNNPHIIQTTKHFIKKAAWCELQVLELPPLSIVCYHYINISSSLSNSSPSLPRPLHSQHFHHIFPTALPHHRWNILYATILQQPSLIANLEQQSLYEEDDSLHNLICVFHHLCSTQISLGSFEPCTDYIVSLTLHILSTVASRIIFPSANISATFPDTAQIDDVPSVTTLDMSLLTVHLLHRSA